MAYSDILAIFCTKFFDTYTQRICMYFANGKNSIRVRLRDVPDKELVFTYNNERDWNLSVVNIYKMKATLGHG